MATAAKPKPDTVNPFDHSEWIEEEKRAPELLRLHVLIDHKYGTTLPTQIDEDGDQEYKPKGKARPIAVFKAGTIAEVPVDLGIRLLRDYGPVRTAGERKAGRPIVFRAVDPEDADRILEERKAAIDSRNEEVRLSRNDAGDGMPLPASEE